MASGIYQMQVTYDASEDRMLLKVSTTDAKEFRVWLTRRFVTMLWATLGQVVTPQNVLTDGSAATKSILMESSYQNTLKKADMSKPFEHKESQEVSFPLGEAPLIADKVVLVESSTGNHRLQLLPKTGQGLDLNLNTQLTTPLIQMIYDAQNKADWGLNLQLPGKMKTAEALPTLLS